MLPGPRRSLSAGLVIRDTECSGHPSKRAGEDRWLFLRRAHGKDEDDGLVAGGG
jgi:hypothetical protein